MIIHRLLPGDTINSPNGEQHIALRGALLSFVYYRNPGLESRRGIVWTWRTGSPIYVSFSLPSDHHFPISTLGFYGLPFVLRFS